MIGAILLLGLSRFTLAGEPAAFENYFDDSVKGVDISQDSAIKACLQNGETLADKVQAAYNKCFGDDYDFDDLAGAVGSSDADSDGLPDSFEGNEACFYEEMSWVDGSGAADAEAIKADLAGLDAGLKGDFDGNIDACAAWSGSFGSRKKREAVPDVMGSGRAALNWLRSAVRKTRSADPEKGEEKESGKGKKNAASKKNGKKSGNGKARSGKKAAKKNGKKSGQGKRKSGKGKETETTEKKEKKSDKKENKSGKGAKKSSSGKESGPKVLDEQTYNKLWCFDLSMEQVLEKCVEEKIKN